jgi:hypothetical protein
MDRAGDYVGEVVGGVKDALTTRVAAPGREMGGKVNELAADLGDLPGLGQLFGAAESATTLLTSAVAPALASVRGAVTGKEPTNQDIEDFTYTPRSAPSAAINQVGRAAAKPIADAAEATGADAALLPFAPELGAVPGRVPPKVQRAAPAAPDMTDPKVAARAAGYKLLPSEAGGGRVAQTLESLAGSQIKKDFRRSNERTTTQLAADDIDAPSVNPKDIEKVRDDGNAAYDAMSSIGKVQADEQLTSAIQALSPRQGMRASPDIAELQMQFEGLVQQPWDAGAVVTEVRQLRKEANANSAPPAMGAKPDPKKVSLAKAQLQVANALDDWLERNATTMGSPEIATQYRQQRQRLAKTASVERASSGGKVDVRNLERQDERGVPHSGRVKIASQTGEYFPESTGAVSGPDINVTPDSLFGTARQLLQSTLLRPVISRILQSDMYQNRIGQTLPDVTPDGPLGGYFDRPPPAAPYEPFAGAPAPGPLPRTSAESMRVASTLAGDLELEGQGVGTYRPEMTAETPPAPRGEVPFTPSQPIAADDLAGDLGVAPEVATDGLRFTPSNLAQSPLGLVEEAPVRAPVPAGAGRLADDLVMALEGLTLDSASPEGPFAFARGEPYSADPRQALPPRTATIREPGAPGFEVERTVDLASDLGLTPELELAPDDLTRVVPDTRRVTTQFGPTERPGFTVARGTDRQVSNMPDRALADELIAGTDSSPELGDMDALMAELNQLALRSRPSAATRPRTQNNASGESSASVEAVNRVAAEKKAGQDRFLIDKDGTVTPLVGVDAVDAAAKPGQVIVQKGVGAEKFTILDRGGLNQGAARGRVNAALSSLEGG